MIKLDKSNPNASNCQKQLLERTNIMGRGYHLSKKLADNQAREILREISELPDIKQAHFSTGLDYLEIETGNQDYSDVMSRAVNIFRRAGGGCELSFARFLH